MRYTGKLQVKDRVQVAVRCSADNFTSVHLKSGAMLSCPYIENTAWSWRDREGFMDFSTQSLDVCTPSLRIGALSWFILHFLPTVCCCFTRQEFLCRPVKTEYHQTTFCLWSPENYKKASTTPVEVKLFSGFICSHCRFLELSVAGQEWRRFPLILAVSNGTSQGLVSVGRTLTPQKGAWRLLIICSFACLRTPVSRREWKKTHQVCWLETDRKHSKYCQESKQHLDCCNSPDPRAGVQAFPDLSFGLDWIQECPKAWLVLASCAWLTEKFDCMNR